MLTNATKDMFRQLPLCVQISGSLRTVKWFVVLTNANKDMFKQLPLCVQISSSLSKLSGLLCEPMRPRTCLDNCLSVFKSMVLFVHLSGLLC